MKTSPIEEELKSILNQIDKDYCLELINWMVDYLKNKLPKDRYSGLCNLIFMSKNRRFVKKNHEQTDLCFELMKVVFKKKENYKPEKHKYWWPTNDKKSRIEFLLSLKELINSEKLC